MRFAGLLWAAFGLPVCLPFGRPFVTEVYYDAPGDDTGWEFVELWNPSGADVALAGLKLQAGDGAGPGRWSTRWTAALGDTLRAGARFVIGGAHVNPAPDAIVTLVLGNGPDALRMLWPDGVTEVVGWGHLAYPEYYCVAPAADAPPGSALARVPDDADLGSDSLDFRVREPSPGRANTLARDVALATDSLVMVPESPPPGGDVAVRLAVVNAGAEALAAGEVTLALAGDALAAPLAQPLPALAAGETLRVALGATAGASGRRALRAQLALAGDERAANDADTLAVRVGPGPLELTEIQFHPALGEGEWLEVRARDAAGFALDGVTLTDRGGTRGRVLGELFLSRDSLALLAQDRDALLARLPGLDSSRVRTLAPWPTLNDRDGPSGTADELWLRESDGLLSDDVAYSGSKVPAGVSLEKVDGVWQPAPSAPGTPLAPPRAVARTAARFAVTPHRIATLGAPVTLSWHLPWPTARVTVELVDLAGHRAAVWLADIAVGADETQRLLALAPAPGVYAVVLRARGGDGELTRIDAVRIVAAQP